MGSEMCIRDSEYMINGSQADVLDHYDMSPEKIAEISKDLLNK